MDPSVIEPNACCAPTRGGAAAPGPTGTAHESTAEGPPRQGTGLSGSDRSSSTDDWIELAGGTFTMGEGGPMAYPADGEDPREATVPPFAIAATAVTNAAFREFVNATAYVSEAERFGWSFVFAGLLPDDFEETRGVAAAPWWRQVYGARWDRPEGPHSTIEDRLDHPVIQVTWNDAQSFAQWSGARLPTEAEWEFAARAGSTTTFPWGSELEPGGRHMMNVFQGTFPGNNTAVDGWAGTCPVRAFEPNGFGLWNMIGNVWEWTADPFTRQGDDLVLKGGSYLCHESYCRRYRPAARMSSTPDSSTGNIGFRLARNQT